MKRQSTVISRPLTVDVVCGLVVAGSMVLCACSESPSGPDDAPADRDAGSWQTWVIASGAAHRPAAPPADGSATATAELSEIIALQRSGRISAEEIARWDGPPTVAWTREVVEQLEFHWPLLPAVRIATPVRAARILTLVHTAMYDAMIASWDAKYTYARTPPHRAHRDVALLVDDPGVPSYPSEHAAAAAAAVRVLAYAFPMVDPARLEDMARRAGESRIAAGVAYPSDVAAGAALGHAIGDAAVARAMSDDSEMPWDGVIPAGPDKWLPTPPRRVATPFDPMAGKWRPWVIARADVFRLEPPPALGSPAFVTDLNELRMYSSSRTPAQADLARYWATGPPPLRWTLLLEDELERRGVSPVRAARAHAILSTTMHDAMLACWDSKYSYWYLRPITADSTLNLVVSTPPFPSYPSGHSTMSYAAYVAMAELFPDKTEAFHQYALDASMSRVYGGIHYRFDVVRGDSLGAKVGREAVRRAQNDGSS